MTGFEEEFSNCPEIISALENKDIATEFYSALCNITWIKVFNNDEEKTAWKLRGNEEHYLCSWRYAGAFISNLRNKHFGKQENYMDFYFSSKEGTVSEFVLESMKFINWRPDDEQ